MKKKKINNNKKYSSFSLENLQEKKIHENTHQSFVSLRVAQNFR